MGSTSAGKALRKAARDARGKVSVLLGAGYHDIIFHEISGRSHVPSYIHQAPTRTGELSSSREGKTDKKEADGGGGGGSSMRSSIQTAANHGATTGGGVNYTDAAYQLDRKNRYSNDNIRQ